MSELLSQSVLSGSGGMNFIGFSPNVCYAMMTGGGESAQRAMAAAINTVSVVTSVATILITQQIGG